MFVEKQADTRAGVRNQHPTLHPQEVPGAPTRHPAPRVRWYLLVVSYVHDFRRLRVARAPGVAMSLVATCALAVAAGPATAGGTRTSAGVPTAGTARCSPPKGLGQHGPGYDASVGNSDSGRSICMQVGQRLLVILRAPASGRDWARPRPSARGYLVAAPMSLMLVRGATGANFRAVKPGTVYLRSSRPVCAPKPGAVSCQAVQAWSVQLVISKK
jgi:hypothetical protein